MQDKLKQSFGMGGVDVSPETTCRKICKLICALMLIVLSAILAGGYASLSMRAGEFNTATAAYSTSEDPQYDKCQLPIGYVVPDAVYDSDDLINNIFDTLQETTSDLADDIADGIDSTIDAA